jgi:hypothetical protein
LRRIWPAVLAALAAAYAEDRFFAGAFVGIATLSADARFEVPQQAAASGYKPENGPAVSPFFGVHVNDYFSLQGSYMWNRNAVRYHALRGTAFYDQRARTTHHLVLGDAMLYFRGRTSWVRPYLAAGGGLAHVVSDAAPAAGTLAGAPGSFDAYSPVLNVAVGIDLDLRRGWKFRYAFAETIQRNRFSERLTPPGERNLAGFGNLFGIVKYFGATDKR